MNARARLTGRPWPGVAEQIARWCATTPLAPAVVQGGRTWTYGELEAAAGAIATALQAPLPGPGRVVAVTGPRGFATVAAWVAVLATRNVLLPLDPGLAPVQSARMVSLAGADLVLALDGTRVPTADGATVLLLDSGQLGPGGGLPQGEPPQPEEPGYVFFTSGSTGQPKAILGRHRSLAHFLTWLRTALHVQPGDRIGHLAGVGFDVTLREVLLPLSAGATLCLPPPAPLPPGQALAWLADNRITLLHAVPTVARAWLRATDERLQLPLLRAVLFSGEPLTDTLVARWRTHLDYRGEIINQYGPTETTLIRCWHRVEDPVPGIQPLGRPIPGSEAWAEDPPGTRVPPGAPGEIVLRTMYGTSGYLRASEEEDARFTFGPDGEVIYRTGDLGHLDADGLLHFHGRRDDQVKIYGVRVHLHAVEAVLEAQPGIHQAAVTAQADADGGAPRLTAHLVLDPGCAAIPGGLRAALLQDLPAAAVPARFLTVDALPRTNSSGKLDRSRLTNPSPSGS
ncbi:amino acid adenylation domain-containing protein [Streptomyces sp. NBC_01433]|uniref:amino acid adenylation domain-containing protein n=1 Tax=Streptomyces sp. NBC_01433 TaxID=2903864 RepID=UPI002255E884|nr:amino acid adenylation domain-containing protein [Streptomyces sp. NBC_01433]MCX4681473.1 amino acid adenylation domain-containing protein [Streptomyces sp. NBC_01433]